MQSLSLQKCRWENWNRDIGITNILVSCNIVTNTFLLLFRHAPEEGGVMGGLIPRWVPNWGFMFCNSNKAHLHPWPSGVDTKLYIGDNFFLGGYFRLTRPFHYLINSLQCTNGSLMAHYCNLTLCLGITAVLIGGRAKQMYLITQTRSLWNW